MQAGRRLLRDSGPENPRMLWLSLGIRKGLPVLQARVDSESRCLCVNVARMFNLGRSEARQFIQKFH